MKLKRKKHIEVPYCPNCFHKLELADNVGGWITPKIYHCPKCNYRGTFYVARDLETKKSTSPDDTNKQIGTK
ncbi:MAG: hypothetical protein JW776_07885 [Candidatus Lokiarchaeota archaeon]|nr:hypothetical protein [Candidatus Lokiarchaeota archaeon]